MRSSIFLIYLYQTLSYLKMSDEQKFKFPTEMIELPSKGLLYPEDHPLASGQVEMKYMTAKEEDILTNQNYISKGIVLDKLLQSLIITKFNYSDLLIGDKNAILIASRILGYGKDYNFTYDGVEQTVDLSSLENKEIDESAFTRGVNEFSYTLPHTNTEVTFQLMTEGLDKKIDREITAIKKINKLASPEFTTRLKHIITSINSDTDPKTIKDFVENYLLAKDARALREHIAEMQPDIDMTTTAIDEYGEATDLEVPITVNFFFPDA
jgi:hypothetical protein